MIAPIAFLHPADNLTLHAHHCRGGVLSASANVRDFPELPGLDSVLELLPVFPSKRAESAHLTTMAKRFREARVKAGLPEDLVLYCGRHDYGTRMLKRTGNLAAVMRTMGHRDVKTAMQYQHPELEIVRAALDQDTTVEKRA
jgi:integrase